MMVKRQNLWITIGDISKSLVKKKATAMAKRGTAGYIYEASAGWCISAVAANVTINKSMIFKTSGRFL